MGSGNRTGGEGEFLGEQANRSPAAALRTKLESGTSMAAPHVAGLVVLLLSANPDLIGQVEEIESIIE